MSRPTSRWGLQGSADILGPPWTQKLRSVVRKDQSVRQEHARFFKSCHMSDMLKYRLGRNKLQGCSVTPHMAGEPLVSGMELGTTT